MNNRLIVGMLLLSLLVAACAPAPIPPAPPAPGPEIPPTVPPETEGVLTYEPSFEPAPCPFDLPPDEIEGETVQCGYVVVPETRSDPASPMIRLAVTVFNSSGDNPQPDPVILLSGGPGEKTVAAALNASYILAPFREKRDLIVFDQRGVGLSQPALECADWVDSAFDVLDEADPEMALKQVYDSTLECAGQLQAQGINLSAYNTTENAADVEDIRRALGYEQYNIYGGSYGSLLAQMVMRDHPEHLRSVILGALYPAEESFFLNAPLTTTDAVMHLLESCAQDEACNGAYPDLKQVLFDAIAQLNADPIPVTLTNPLDGQSHDALLTGDAVFQNLVTFLYFTNIIPVLPQAIFDVASGNYDLMIQLSSQRLALFDALSRGMEFSVLCAEDLIGKTAEDFLAVWDQLPPELSRRSDPEDELEYGILAICQQWPVSQADPSFKLPVSSDLPTLLLEGEFDPVTPTAYAEAVAEHLDNGHLFTFPGVGHNVLVASPCARQIATAFIDDPDKAPDSSCIDTLPGVVFDLPKDQAGEITLEPFTSEQDGLSAVGPQQWDNPATGTFMRRQNALDPTALIYDVLDMNEEEVLDLLMAQLRLDDLPVSAGEMATDGFQWTLYAVEVQGTAVDFAIDARDADTSLLVVLQSKPEEREMLRETVFLPALKALTETEAEGEPTEPGASITLIPFTSEAFGIEGVVPDGWSELAPGVANRGQDATDLVRLIQQAAPAMTVVQLTASLLPQLGIPALPESTTSLETDAFTWDLYEIDVEAPGVGTVKVDLALAETGDAAYIVLLQMLPDEYEALHEAVFLPAVEALSLPVDDEAEARYEHPDGLFSVPIPTNWSAEQLDDYAQLTSPDGEISVYVMAMQADDLEAAVAQGWRLVDPEFDLDPDEVIDEPVTNGAERAITITYDTGDDETIIVGGGWLHEGIAYLEYFTTNLEAYQKRVYQLATILSGYKIAALEDTDLSGAEPLPLDDELLAELESYIGEKMEQFDVPGAAVAIVKDGGVVYAEGFGVRNLETQEPVTPETLMMIGSTTKSMTTMLMAHLVDQGVFDWDTRVVDIMPSFRVADPEVTDEITMRNMVCACSGVPRRDLEWLFNADQLSAEDIIESLAEFEFFTDFGEAFQYSNQMVAAAGYLATLANGAQYGDLHDAYVNLMQDNVFDPIGMADTTFDFEEVRTSSNYATPYGQTLMGEMMELPLSTEEVLVPIGSAGAAWSNVLDMASYVMTDLASGVAPDGRPVVSAENLAVTWEPQVDITADMSYGLGWMVEDWNGVPIISHGGNTFGFTSELAFLPKHGIGISILSNQQNSFLNQVVRYRLLELLFEQESEVEPQITFALEQIEKSRAELEESLQASIDEAAVEPYLGSYANQALGEMTLRWEGDQLVLDVGEFVLELQAREDDGKIEYLTVTPPVVGMPVKLEENDQGNPVVVFGIGVVEYTFESVD